MSFSLVTLGKIFPVLKSNFRPSSDSRDAVDEPLEVPDSISDYSMDYVTLESVFKYPAIKGQPRINVDMKQNLKL